jgi:hypothetical protein
MSTGVPVGRAAAPLDAWRRDSGSSKSPGSDVLMRDILPELAADVLTFRPVTRRRPPPFARQPQSHRTEVHCLKRPFTATFPPGEIPMYRGRQGFVQLM